MSNKSPWGPFDWEDPFLFNQQLTDEELMVKDTVAKYAQDKLAPRVIKMYREEGVDRSIFQEMGELSTDVRKEVLDSTYRALYVVFFSILEGNTRF